MKIGRCPTCHAHIQLEAVCQDDAGRELLALLAGLEADLGRALVAYIGLFRPASRDLTNDRALRLAQEVLRDFAPGERLSAALAATVESIRAKGGAQLRNHNYLRIVLEGMPAHCAALPAAREPAARKGPASKHRAALDAIDGG
jgi:hypothetical protein